MTQLLLERIYKDLLKILFANYNRVCTDSIVWKITATYLYRVQLT